VTTEIGPARRQLQICPKEVSSAADARRDGIWRQRERAFKGGVAGVTGYIVGVDVFYFSGKTRIGHGRTSFETIIGGGGQAGNGRRWFGGRKCHYIRVCVCLASTR